MTITINYKKITAAMADVIGMLRPEVWIMIIATSLAIGATIFSFSNELIISYGDAESHLNISKRVVDSLTPGFAQLGGIWLPLPHLLMAPLVYFDFFWRTGFAGSIVSGISFVIAAVYIYKLTYLILKHTGASFLAAMLFVSNPNILYLQSTPMTEVLLIVFFVLSSYFFIRYLYNTDDIYALLLAGLYGFFSTLSRYDGWFLVIIEVLILTIMYVPRPFGKDDFTIKGIWEFIKCNIPFRKTEQDKRSWEKTIGKIALFATLSFFGIMLWLGWDALILGDPLYFTHSEFSAKSQQTGWAAKGQLPAQWDIVSSFVYYFVTAMSNVGMLIFFIGVIGFGYYVILGKSKYTHYISLLLLVPFIFNVITLFLGQSIIFIPHLTPTTFDWILFNVRYGVMMVPATAFFVAYLFYKSKTAGRWVIGLLIMVQFVFFSIGYSDIVSLTDGAEGLSSAKKSVDAEQWMQNNYDEGLLLVDDFARVVSLIRSGIDMKDVIYIGNKPYWNESLVNPEKYATWIIVHQNDTLWRTIYEPEQAQAHLYKYFTKVYTSPEILIFKRTAELGSDVEIVE